MSLAVVPGPVSKTGGVRKCAGVRSVRPPLGVPCTRMAAAFVAGSVAGVLGALGVVYVAMWRQGSPLG